MTDDIQNGSVPIGDTITLSLKEEVVTDDTTSRIKGTKAELLVKINNLEQVIADNDKVLIEAGLIERETKLTKIKDREQFALRAIQVIITQCEQETGRSLIVSVNIDEPYLKR